MMDLVLEKLPANWKIKECSTRPLTAPGDHYGSSMKAVTVSLVHETTREEKSLQLIAKMCPTSTELCEAFQVDKTFVKEAAMYTVVAPLLRKFQEEHGIPEDQRVDSFIECFGARKSLDATKDTVDSDAVLILENLNFKGFEVGDRSKGFDLKVSEFVLRNLAKFHAVLIAYRVHRLGEFMVQVLPHLKKLAMGGGMDKETLRRMRQDILDSIATIPEISPLLEQLKRQINICDERHADTEHLADSAFNTFCHCDLWVNNMMIKYEESEPKAIKFFDFQFIKFGSLAEDLVFFLFASVEKNVLLNEMDHLIEVYYQAFVAYLQLHGCQMAEFSREKFHQEIESFAKYELLHILTMTKVFYMDKAKLAAMEGYDNEAMFNKDLLGPDYYEKLKIVVLEFQKRGWLIKEDDC